MTTPCASNNRESFKAEAPLPDARHEAFAHGIAKGQTLGAAYRGAGYAVASAAAARSNGCRLRGRPEVAARILHLRASAAMESGGRVDRETKILILERLIRDAGLSASERLAAIAAHEKYVDRDDADRAPPDPGTIAVWIMDETEARPPDHLRAVLAAVARVYRITPDVLAGIAAGLACGAETG